MKIIKIWPKSKKSTETNVDFHRLPPGSVWFVYSWKCWHLWPASNQLRCFHVCPFVMLAHASVWKPCQISCQISASFCSFLWIKNHFSVLLIWQILNDTPDQLPWHLHHCNLYPYSRMFANSLPDHTDLAVLCVVFIAVSSSLLSWNLNQSR